MLIRRSSLSHNTAELIQQAAFLLDKYNQSNLAVEEVRRLIVMVTEIFSRTTIDAGFEKDPINKIITKFRDGGRRSPPWQPGSETGARRPQDGADGNRQSRWLFAPTHRYYADEITATMTEVRYFLQALSMSESPPLLDGSLDDPASVLLRHEFGPERFLDPIQVVPISLVAFADNRRYVEVGHIVPIGRGGKHNPENATLMLRESNRMQNDMTIPEFMTMIKGILERNGYSVTELTPVSPTTRIAHPDTQEEQEQFRQATS